jgi:hypothetical protein
MGRVTGSGIFIMNRFFAILTALLLAGFPLAAPAQMSEADARLMENMAADEDGWANDGEMPEEAPPVPENDPGFRAEQNPQESLRRMTAPVRPQDAPGRPVR